MSDVSSELHALFAKLDLALRDVNRIADDIRTKGGESVRIYLRARYNDDTGFADVGAEITTGRVVLPLDLSEEG